MSDFSQNRLLVLTEYGRDTPVRPSEGTTPVRRRERVVFDCQTSKVSLTDSRVGTVFVCKRNLSEPGCLGRRHRAQTYLGTPLRISVSPTGTKGGVPGCNIWGWTRRLGNRSRTWDWYTTTPGGSIHSSETPGAYLSPLVVTRGSPRGSRASPSERGRVPCRSLSD